MQRRPPSFSGALRRQVINDRIRPGISYHVKVFVFVYDGNKVFLYIPAVAEDDDIFLFMEYRHYMPYHGCSQFQLGFLFLPHAVSKRNGKIVDPAFVPYRDTDHYTYEAVSVQIV